MRAGDCYATTQLTSDLAVTRVGVPEPASEVGESCVRESGMGRHHIRWRYFNRRSEHNEWRVMVEVKVMGV